ncbi:hypothetical protein CerSpe_116950 [Prunus speciosa]
MKCPDDVKIRLAGIQKYHSYNFLASLDDEFDKIRGDLLRLSPLPKLEESFAFGCKEVQHQEKMLKKHGKTKSSVVMVSKAHAASFYFPRPTAEEKENMHCNYCNENRHTEATCFYKNGFPEWFLKHQKQRKVVHTKKKNGESGVA